MATEYQRALDRQALAKKPRETLSEWAERATPEEVERADWRVVAEGMRKMRTEIESNGANHSWIGVYIAIADLHGKEPIRTTPHPSQSYHPDVVKYHTLCGQCYACGGKCLLRAPAIAALAANPPEQK